MTFSRTPDPDDPIVFRARKSLNISFNVVTTHSNINTSTLTLSPSLINGPVKHFGNMDGDVDEDEVAPGPQATPKKIMSSPSTSTSRLYTYEDYEDHYIWFFNKYPLVPQMDTIREIEAEARSPTCNNSKLADFRLKIKTRNQKRKLKAIKDHSHPTPLQAHRMAKRVAQKLRLLAEMRRSLQKKYRHLKKMSLKIPPKGQF
ncbi:hypothetical protein BDZ97DRAFT_1923461 [Flammula alnicola]|nr:hypothetical protein BDZ97DRAFT_1923461 [Flammula alnicola]